MSAEEQWAMQREWDSERGELEIDFTKLAEVGETCMEPRCTRTAITVFCVVEVGRKFSAKQLALCPEHADADNAFALYNYFEGQ